MTLYPNQFYLILLGFGSHLIVLRLSAGEVRVFSGGLGHHMQCQEANHCFSKANKWSRLLAYLSGPLKN